MQQKKAENPFLTKKVEVIKEITKLAPKNPKNPQNPRWQQLYQEHIRKQEKLKEREYLKKMKEDSEVDQFTFKPKINPQYEEEYYPSDTNRREAWAKSLEKSK